MTEPGRLSRAFFARPSPVVARDLLGRDLVRRVEDGSRVRGRIVETEAYQEDDPASHSHRGRTARNDVMFREPGLLYVYFTYGMHFCLNAVTGRSGEGSAVLVRALEPLEGLEQMELARKRSDPRLLCAGPARLCQALGVTREDDGTDLVTGASIWMERGVPVTDEAVRVTTRIGVRHGADRPWRFLIEGSPWTSRAGR